MRIFTFIVSGIFSIIGMWMIADGRPDGWLVAGFFGLCLLVAIFEPRLSKRRADPGYRVLMTAEDVACVHPIRARESIRWEDVNRVWYVTTSEGPRLPDEWLLFEGENGGCSFPTEVPEIKSVWGEIERRFPGFDFGPIVRGGTDDVRHLCWERGRPASGVMSIHDDQLASETGTSEPTE